MQIRHDWLKLKEKFVLGAWITLSDFYRDNQIKDNSRTRTSCKGWLEEKRKYQEEVIRKTREQVLEKESSVRARQQKIALQLQVKGLKKLQEKKPEDTKTALRMLLAGLQEEREALNLNGDNQLNTAFVNPTLPKTRLDEIIEKADYWEILEIIADLKRINIACDSK